MRLRISAVVATFAIIAGAPRAPRLRWGYSRYFSATGQHGFPRIRPNDDLSVEIREIRAGLSLLLLSQREVHRDLRFDLDDLTIEDVRPILPLAYRVDCRRYEHWMA